MIAGIYKIVNVINKKFYIGSSKDIYKRWKRHLKDLENKRHHSIYLQRAWDKNGSSAFELEILKQIDNPSSEILLKEESDFITNLRPEYNVGGVGGGDNISNHPNLDKIKEKHSRNLKQKWQSQEFREKKIENSKGSLNPNWKGGVCSPKCENCKCEISAYRKRCVSCSKLGELNGFFGKTHSEKTKKILSDKHRGKTLSDETKDKLRQITMKLREDPDFVKRTDLARKRGEEHPLFGTERPENVKNALSTSAKKRFKSLDFRLRLIKNGASKAIFANNLLFLSKSSACAFFGISECAMKNRCISSKERWKNFSYVTYEFVMSNIDKLHGDFE